MWVTGFSLGTSTSSRVRESQLSETEVSTVVTGQARISADSFNNQLDIAPSDPAAFLGLIFETDKR